MADQVLAEWALSEDEKVRFDGLALIDDFPIATAIPALQKLAKRLASLATLCRFPRSFTARSSRHLTAPDVTVSRCGHCGGRS